MPDDTQYYDLRCPECSWGEHCGPEEIAQWLRKARKLRPGREPEPEILYEVFRGTAGQLACPRCGRAGLVAAPADDEADWPVAPRCRACRQPISAERLGAVPEATLCADCQSQEEDGQPAGEVEYCPRCGAPMALRLSKAAGLARYVLVCTGTPPCR